MRAAENFLCIVPPYFTSGAPPLGPASLLAYLRANGHDDFQFLDLRLWVPNAYAPTYRPVGVFGETYIMDVPDLPLVLGVLQHFANGQDPVPDLDDRFTRYCLERGIIPSLLYDYLADMNRFLESAMAQLPDVKFIGFSVWSSNYLTTLMALAHLKRRKNPPYVVLGGPQTTESEASAKLALRSGLADVVAVGEGEATLLDLYEKFRESKGEPATVVPGTLRYNSQSGQFESARRPLVKLPGLPLPAFDKVPLMAYQRRPTSHRTITYELSRGCTDKCVFCSEWVFWKRIRNDAISHVVDNIVRLQQMYGCEAIWFMDSLLNATASRLYQLGEELLRRDVRIKWGGYLRANVDRETAALLKRAGCEFVFVGVESLSDETLAKMNKNRTEEDNLGALHALLGAGIDRVVAGFIPGFPGDTRERFGQTALALENIHRSYPGHFRVNVEPFVMSPKQPMYHEMENYGLESKPWSADYLDIAGQYSEITSDILCSVDGSNQGVDRMGELQIARVVTATSPSEPDPFLYYEGEAVSTGALEIREMMNGWYMGLLKTDYALMYGLILTREERTEYERLKQNETVASGLGYGRSSQSSLLRREPFTSYLKKIEDLHLVPPRRELPDIRNGLYHRGTPAATDELVLSPFVVARTVAGGDEPAAAVLDFVSARWHIIDGRWTWLFRRLSEGPVSTATLTSEGAADTAAEIERLIELGVVWTTSEARKLQLKLAQPSA
ncbi:B12-binding domain-containing radical SAM protein [Amycolatopsis pithecellobii]|uniref:Radical SAM protein n=1 Tax=Amycolatopsis pithecellobii TaxID=664692 RepID=A0A6N7Z559_9PSEU|nr:radical SAM protein [Amycolatopsis pithecellobii]MTD55590.1 radical SAM protein [Amycolatopsis pithecellobii]